MSDCCAPQGQDRGWAPTPHLCPSRGPQHGGVALCPTPPPGATTARPSHEALRLGVTAWDGAIPPHPSPARAGPGTGPGPRRPAPPPGRTGPVFAARGWGCLSAAAVEMSLGPLGAARDGDRRRRVSAERSQGRARSGRSVCQTEGLSVSPEPCPLVPGSWGPLAALRLLLMLGVGGAGPSPWQRQVGVSPLSLPTPSSPSCRRAHSCCASVSGSHVFSPEPHPGPENCSERTQPPGSRSRDPQPASAHGHPHTLLQALL